MYSLLRKISLSFVLLALCTVARAQFYLSENDPASIRWKSVQNGEFKVIYPTGCDSLGRLYIDALEKYRPMDGLSLGMTAGQYQRLPIDVILHTRNASSNGSVTWTPSRMEMFTIPAWSNPDPMQWHMSLAVHEGRHAAQMQNGYRKVFKPFYYILGEIIPSFAAVYPGTLLLEGDAVVAETALTNSGRGRSGDFLEYYMYSLDNGDRRNWMRWLLGSYYRYTPNQYAFGYLLTSGMRTRYDAPLFMADYLDYVSRRPYDPWPLRHTMRRTSGTKFRTTLSGLFDWHYGIWAEDALARGPFMAVDTIGRATRRLTLYDNPVITPYGNILLKKRDLYHLQSLVILGKDGTERRVAGISSKSGRISASADRGTFYWNELRKDPRWGQVNSSVIRNFDLRERKVSTVRLPKGNYINPVVFSGDTLAAINYLEKGEIRIELINTAEDCVCGHIGVPAGLQPYQMAVCGGKIYAAAVSEGGCGLWCADVGAADIRNSGRNIWKPVLEPQPVRISSLGCEGNGIVFSSDRNGVNEFYRFNTATGELAQLTDTRYGGTDFAIKDNGDIVFPQYNTNGTRMMLIQASEAGKEVEWEDIHRYRIADSLSRQEAALAAGRTKSLATGFSGQKIQAAAADTVSASARWVKGAHAIRFHSWAPAYVDIDNIQNISFDRIQKTASFGAMGFFQNSMSTLYGYVGYKAAPASWERAEGTWYHSGHLKLTYSGLYPVFELDAHIGDGRATDGWYNEKRDTLFTQTSNRPYVNVGFRTYVPFSWNAGVWNFGVIPDLQVIYTNSRVESDYNFDIHAGIRGYAVQNTPSACVYPRWGIGAEARYIGRLSYFYLYGYVPGICCGQGLRLSSTYQIQSKGLSPFINSYANVLPRGIQGLGAYTGIKCTAEYAIPFNMGDWHIFDMFYCTRGIVSPHFDWSWLPPFHGDLYSVGASFEMEFGSFFWVRTPVTLGVTYSYNGGSLIGEGRDHYVGVLFNIDIPN